MGSWGWGRIVSDLRGMTPVNGVIMVLSLLKVHLFHLVMWIFFDHSALLMNTSILMM